MVDVEDEDVVGWAGLGGKSCIAAAVAAAVAAGLEDG